MKTFIVKFIVCLLLFSHSPIVAKAQGFSATDFGHVTVGKPKIWRFDRIFSTLDGLLRDIDAVQLQSLTKLDANASNQTVLDFLTTSLNVKAGFDQKDAILNSLERERITSIRDLELQNLQAFRERRKQAQDQVIEIRRKLAEARERKANLDPNSEDQLKIEDHKIAVLTEEEKRNLDIINQNPPNITPVDKSVFENTEGIHPTPLPAPLISPNDLIGALKTELTNANSKPSLPATKQLDNFITLLHERLSRQLSIAFDDNGRSKDLYLVQFDIGVYPYKDANNHVVYVEFDITDKRNNPLQAYDLYPAASSYNITEYWGKSRGTGIAASAAFLFGFGIGAEYKRQRDQVRSALTQSVYMSGFGAGTSKFGWYIGAAPFDKLISPGTRTAYAVIAVENGESQNVKFTPTIKWVHRSKGSSYSSRTLDSISVELSSEDPRITRFAYQTQYSANDTIPKETENQQNKPEEFASVQITFNQTIDPNLVITVNGELLPRLRDQRGRATSEEPATSNNNNRGPQTAVFGLLETDSDNRSHWFAMGPRNISLKLAKSLVGIETFPRIRILTGSKKGEVEFWKFFGPSQPPDPGRTTTDDNWEIIINDFTFRPDYHNAKPPPLSAFLPLFSTVDYVNVLYAWLEGKDSNTHVNYRDSPPSERGPHVVEANKRERRKIRINYKDGPPSDYARIDERAQVVLIDNDKTEHIALDCSGYGELECRLPKGLEIVSTDGYRISIERPARNGVKGVADIVELKNRPPEKEPKLKGEYKVVKVKGKAGDIRGWHISLPAENLSLKDDKIEGFGELLGPDSLPPILMSSATLAFGEDANYHVDEKTLEIWVPLRNLCFLLQSRLKLERNGVYKFKLPDFAPGILPSVKDLNESNGYVTIKGDNLGLVEKVIINGCDSPCDNLRIGVSNGLITFAKPKNVTGAFPIQFLLKGGGGKIDAADTDGITWGVKFTTSLASSFKLPVEDKSKRLFEPTPAPNVTTPLPPSSLKSEKGSSIRSTPPRPAPAPKEIDLKIRSKQNIP